MPGLNPFDDYPFHQTAAPIDVPATSDSHFNDGYYFAFYRPDVHVFCGLRLHPNSNVMDGYAGVVWEGEQRDVRFSRALRPRANDLAVGPFRLDIVERIPHEWSRQAYHPATSSRSPSTVRYPTARATWV